MNKKKVSLLLTSIVATTGIALCAIFNTVKSLGSSLTKADDYTMAVLFSQSKNRFATNSTVRSGSNIARTELNSEITFAYTGLCYDTNNTWGTLKGEVGSIYNVTPINGLDRLVFEVNSATEPLFTLLWSRNADFSDAQECLLEYSTYVISFPKEDNPLYFKIVNNHPYGGEEGYPYFDLVFDYLYVYYSCSDATSNLTILSEDETKGTVNDAGGATPIGSQQSITATPKSGYIFDGWYDQNNSLVTRDNPYSFKMPTSDLYFVAKFAPEEDAQLIWDLAHGAYPYFDEYNNTLSYGLYPQTHIKNEVLISALENLYVEGEWTLYNDTYYCKQTAANEWYGVFDDGIDIVVGESYWFKCEPIKWRVLSDYYGELLLLSDLVIDAHIFGENYTGQQNDRYASNYEYSEMRCWLNGNFYDNAFALDDTYIETTEVDNWVDSKYNCNNTDDKVFLFSKTELDTYLGTYSANRICKSSDYARVFDYDMDDEYASYFTRTPTKDNAVGIVNPDGNYFTGYNNVDIVYGVRPLITVDVFDLSFVDYSHTVEEVAADFETKFSKNNYGGALSSEWPDNLGVYRLTFYTNSAYDQGSSMNVLTFEESLLKKINAFSTTLLPNYMEQYSIFYDDPEDPDNFLDVHGDGMSCYYAEYRDRLQGVSFTFMVYQRRPNPYTNTYIDCDVIIRTLS